MEGCDGDLNDNGRALLQLCCSNAHHQRNFQDINLHLYIGCRDSFCHRSLMDFCIISADLFQSMLDVRVKWGAEL